MANRQPNLRHDPPLDWNHDADPSSMTPEQRQAYLIAGYLEMHLEGFFDEYESCQIAMDDYRDEEFHNLISVRAAKRMTSTHLLGSINHSADTVKQELAVRFGVNSIGLFPRECGEELPGHLVGDLLDLRRNNRLTGEDLEALSLIGHYIQEFRKYARDVEQFIDDCSFEREGVYFIQASQVAEFMAEEKGDVEGVWKEYKDETKYA